MTVLTSDELTELRQGLEALAVRKGIAVAALKAEVNNALQAIEDKWEEPSTKTVFSNAINAATTFNFTNQHKKILFRFWLTQKARREELLI